LAHRRESAANYFRVVHLLALGRSLHTIVVAISGLIYASILSIDLYFIHNRIGDDVSEREQEDRAVESKKPHAMSLAAIPGFGFFVIGLVCLYHLLNAL
jgi:hypothetical protein